MPDNCYELDPEGDLMLHLENPDAAFAVWREGNLLPDPPAQEHRSRKKKRKNVEKGKDMISRTESIKASHQEVDLPLEPAELDVGEYAEGNHPFPESKRIGVQIRVSSSHLILASLHFKRMLKGGWKEGGTRDSNGCCLIRLEEWDTSALLTLMSIIHGRTRKVPRSVNLEMLAKIAVLVDYYECTEVVEVFIEMWVDQLKDSFPQKYSRDLLLWICIAWVFRLPEQFTAATKIAVEQCEGPIQTLNLPVPEKITEEINLRREKLINQLISALHNLLKKFCEGRNLCSFECSSILLGALTMEMHSRNLFNPRPAKPFLGFSFTTTIKRLRDI